MAVFAIKMDASDVKRGAAEAAAAMKDVAKAAEQASSSIGKATGTAKRNYDGLSEAAKAAGMFNDSLGRLHASNGRFASSSEKAAIQARAVGSNSEKAGKQVKSMGTETNSAAIALNKAATVSNELNRKLMSLAQTALTTYSAYKLLNGAVAATNVGIQANAAWESQKLSIASIISSTNSLADAQGRILEGNEKFIASQQVAEKLMQRLQQLGLETTATTQELVNGFQAIIAPALKAGYALEEIPELATRAAQAMGAFQIPIQQMRTEVEALLSGNINKAQDLLAPYLNISKELVKEWKAQGILVEEINKRLESFKYSGDAIANTWEGLVSNTKEYVEFISRGSTDGLFNSMKASISQLQQLLITFNKETGKPEISQNINNIREAYERLNNFIGDKILTATYAFSDALRDLNDADTLANLETTFSNVWDAVVSIGTGAGEAALEIGSIATAAIDGWNNLPDTIREIGLFGIALYGKKGVLTLASVAVANRFIQNTMKAIALVQSGELSNSEWASMTGDELDEWIKNYEKKQKQSIDAISGYSKDKNAEALIFIRNQYREQTASIEKELLEQQRLYEIYSQNAKNYDFDIYGREAAQEQADNIAQRIDAIKSKLNEVTDALRSINQEATSFDLEELFPTAPFSDSTASFVGLLTTSRLFGQSLFTAKKAVNDLDGTTAEVSFNLNFTGGAQNFLSGDPGEGTPFAIDAWRQATLGFFKEMQDGIRATSTLGKTAADDGKKKAKQIESALHSVESELNRLQMTDAQFKQWQVNEKVEKLEKLLGASNPKVIELRAALEKELHDNILKDILSYADPAAAAVAKVDKEYQDFLSNIELLKKSDPARYTQLMTKAETEHEKALRKAERASKEQNEHLQEKLSFYKELEEMSGAFGLSLEVQNRLLDEQMEIFRDADIPENLIQTWREYKDLMNSHDWADGAQRAFLQYRADATDAAKGAEEAFSSLYSGMDSGWKSAWEQMIETGKVSLSSFRSVFVSFLADLMHMAITRPITVQIAGVVSGMLGTGGVAYAAGSSGGVGGMSNLSGLSNLMPSSWFSGIGNAINDTMAGWFPGTFAMSGAAGTVMTPVVGAADIAGLKAAEAAMLGGNAGGGMAASGGTFLSAVSPYLMAGGLGSLGYTMLGGALGLPQSKYSGLTAGLGGAAGWGLGSLAAGSFASIGATMGSVVPVVGTLIGALAGGALGSLFGQERKTHPSVYGHMMDQGYTTDTQTYIDAFMNQATYDRAGKTEASAYAQVIGEAASQTAGNILNLAAMLPDEYKKNVEDQLESATWSAGRGYSGASWNLQNWKEGMAEERIQEAVDDMFEQMGYGANKAFAEAGIGDLFDSFDLSTEEGFKKAQTAISAISSITTAIDEIKAPTSEAEQQAKAFVAQMDALGEAVKASGLNAAYADEMLSDYRTAYVDNYVNSLEEMFNPLSQIEQQAKGYKEAIDGYVAALTTMGASEAQLAQVRGYTQDAIDNITGSLDAAFFPLSEVETQTKATMESLLAYKSALETLGASAEELTRIDAAWGKMQSDLLDKARAYVSTTPEVVSQAAAMNAEFDALRKAMELAGNATADLTELEQTRAQAVAALQAQYAESFRQTYAQRYATLTGDTNGLANLQQQASFSSELAEIEKTWGKDSEQYRQMQALQDAEAAKQRLEQAQTAYAALQAQLEKQQAELKQLEQQAVQLQIEEIQKLQTASKERIAALEKELSAAQKLHDTWEDVFATAYAKRVDLYQGNTNLDVFGRLDTAQGEFDRLYGLAIGGDADAAKEMAGVASELLGLRGETTANRDDYLDAFYDVDKKLKEVSAYADAQVSDAQKQIDTLQAQLEAENAQYSILVSQLSAQQAALSALNGQTQTLASIQAQIAKLKTEINITIDGKNVASSTVGNAQGDYDDAKDHVDQTKPVVGIYGSKYLTEYDLLVAKVASLNATKVDGRTDWTVADARKSMLDWYGSIEGWYKDAGKREGFEHGGLATPGGPKMFGERGIEYGDVEQPTRIYDATKTRLMLEGGHEYAREAYKGMSEFSRMLARTSGARGDGNKEETAALRKEVRELRGMLKAMLTSVVKNTKDVRDFLEEFEETGLPPQRVNA